MEEFLLDLIYKNKTVKFRVVNPDAPLSTLMNNLRHAVGNDGKLIFDFPSIDNTGAPIDYFFGKEDPEVHEVRVLQFSLLSLSSKKLSQRLRATASSELYSARYNG